jgi:hypothetical protein
MRKLNFLSLSALVLALSLPLSGSAQETPQPTISTDRPSVGTGTDLVPRHWVVSENGASLTAPGGTLTVDGPENLVRVGAFQNVELRWSSPSVQRAQGVPGVQHQDASFGAKIHLPAPKAWPLSAVLTLSAPIGSQGVTSGGWDPAGLLAASHAWGPRLSTFASANFASVSGAGRGRENADQLATFTTLALNGKTTAYAEFAPLLSRDPGLQAYTSDAGVLWLVGKRIQFDVRAGSTVDSKGVHPVVGFGYSVLFSPRIPGRAAAAR